MKKTTQEWVRKAEGDFDVVLLMRRSRSPRRYDAICFHCQQCVEKYLKARLENANLPVPKIHDLEDLLKRLLPLEPLWGIMRRELRELSFAAVTTRYPGKWADRKMATDAFKVCQKMRELARQTLGLKK